MFYSRNCCLICFLWPKARILVLSRTCYISPMSARLIGSFAYHFPLISWESMHLLLRTMISWISYRYRVTHTIADSRLVVSRSISFFCWFVPQRIYQCGTQFEQLYMYCMPEHQLNRRCQRVTWPERHKYMTIQRSKVLDFVSVKPRCALDPRWTSWRGAMVSGFRAAPAHNLASL